MTNSDEILNFYKELYYKESERKEQITNSLNIHIGVITGFLTIQFYLITSFNFELSKILSSFFIILCFTTLGLSLFSIYNLLLTYSNFLKGFTSTGLPTAKEIEKYRLELVEYHTNLNKIDLEFKKYLIEEYIKNYDSLLQNNDRRVQFLFLSKKYSIIGLTFILVASLLFLINFFKKPDEIKKIEIINLQKIEETLIKVKVNTDSLLKMKLTGKVIPQDTLKFDKNGK